MDGGAEIDALELRTVMEVSRDRAQKMRDMSIEGQGGDAVLRRTRRLVQVGGEVEL